MAITDPGARGQVYNDIMFNRATADTTLTQMNQGVTTTQGTYTPLANGYLLKVVITLTAQAATSLAQTGYITLTCTSFQPINTVTIALNGYGLQTAPAFPNRQIERNLNLPVSTALAIKGQDIFQYSPVTPALYVEGVFWTGGAPKVQTT